LDKIDKHALQVAKEVVIKFIEVGRISPNNFGEIFAEIYNSVLDTVAASASGDEDGD
jgi:hypothetical protein